MDAQVLAIAIASIAIGFHLGRVLAQVGQKQREEQIRLSIAQQYHDRWEAMFGAPTPTTRDDQRRAQVVDLRSRKK